MDGRVHRIVMSSHYKAGTNDGISDSWGGEDKIRTQIGSVAFWMGSNQEVQAKQEKVDANQMKVKAGLEQMRVKTKANLKEITAE